MLLTYILVISVSLLKIKFLTISLVCNLQTHDFKGDSDVGDNVIMVIL